MGILVPGLVEEFLDIDCGLAAACAGDDVVCGVTWRHDGEESGLGVEKVVSSSPELH